MSVAILISTEEEQKLFSFDDEYLYIIKRRIQEYVGENRILGFDTAYSDEVSEEYASDLYDMLDELQDSTW